MNPELWKSQTIGVFNFYVKDSNFFILLNKAEMLLLAAWDDVRTFIVHV
jgi:hypothetical protein